MSVKRRKVESTAAFELGKILDQLPEDTVARIGLEIVPVVTHGLVVARKPKSHQYDYPFSIEPRFKFSELVWDIWWVDVSIDRSGGDAGSLLVEFGEPGILYTLKTPLTTPEDAGEFDAGFQSYVLPHMTADGTAIFTDDDLVKDNGWVRRGLAPIKEGKADDPPRTTIVFKGSLRWPWGAQERSLTAPAQVCYAFDYEGGRLVRQYSATDIIVGKKRIAQSSLHDAQISLAFTVSTSELFAQMQQIFPLPIILIIRSLLNIFRPKTKQEVEDARAAEEDARSAKRSAWQQAWREVANLLSAAAHDRR